jgi:hypothetical protein
VIDLYREFLQDSWEFLPVFKKNPHMDQRVTKVFGGALRAEIPYKTNSYSTSHGGDALNTGRPSIKKFDSPLDI